MLRVCVYEYECAPVCVHAQAEEAETLRVERQHAVMKQAQLKESTVDVMSMLLPSLDETSAFERKVAVTAAAAIPAHTAQTSADFHHIDIVSCFHNCGFLAFHRTAPETLATQVDVVKCILKLNALSRGTHKPKKSNSGAGGKRKRGAQGASGAVNGRYWFDICAVANEMGVHVADVQRDLMKLKANREVSMRWER